MFLVDSTIVYCKILISIVLLLFSSGYCQWRVLFPLIVHQYQFQSALEEELTNSSMHTYMTYITADYATLQYVLDRNTVEQYS